MILRNLYEGTKNVGPLCMAICTSNIFDYEKMKFYAVRFPCKVNENGFLIQNVGGYLDLFEVNDFNAHFQVIDGNEETLDKHLAWLVKCRHFTINIQPMFYDDRFWFDYSIDIGFPFIKKKVHMENIETYAKAVKTIMNIAKDACFERHANEGVSKWLNYSRFKKS